MHYLFYKDIDGTRAGEYRTVPVFISGSAHPVTAAADIPRAMEGLIHWEGTMDSLHPVEAAALIHQKFVFIHPFIDGNGRVGRLLMNTVLIQRGYLPIIIPPIRRLEYIQLLEKAHEDVNPFIDFIAEMEIQSQEEIIRLLHLDKP